MKKHFSALLLFLLVGSLTFAQGHKVGFCNVEYIFYKLPEMKQIQQELQTYQQMQEKKLVDMQRQFEQKYQEFLQLQQQQTTSPYTLQEKQNDLEYLQKQIQTLQMKAQDEIIRKTEEKMRPIDQKVKNAIAQVAKERGFDYVLNSGTADGQSFLIHVSDEEMMNITFDVLKKLGVTIPESER